MSSFMTEYMNAPIHTPENFPTHTRINAMSPSCCQIKAFNANSNFNKYRVEVDCILKTETNNLRTFFI